MKNKSLLMFGAGLTLTFLVFLFFSQCSSPVTEFSDKKWTIRADAQKESITIRRQKLGVILRNVQLAIKEGSILPLSGWSVNIENKALIVSTQDSQTVWKFVPEENSLHINCSLPTGVIQGTAPASSMRIPARQKDQDNGIMYTSLGLVSSRNIHCLFDRETNTMIQFPEASLLERSESDDKLMDIAFPVKKSSPLILTPDYYLKELGLKYYKPIPQRFSTAPVGWCSWYCYYMGTTEEDMVRETNALAKYLKPYGLEYVQLDACFTRGKEANYLEWTKEAFPHGGKWIFQYIKDKGLKPGLWVNVYGSNHAHAEIQDQYPSDYYLKDSKGTLSSACCTADDTVVRLDYTHPEVIENHLKPMLKVLKEDWGLTYLKDAGWGTWMDYYKENRENAAHPSKGSREVYVEVQKAVRETLGPDVYINGCAMHEVGLCFGIFDGSRTGGDDKAVWYPKKEGGMSMQTFFHSLFGSNYLHNITWFCDPDTVMVRNPLTIEEAKTIVSSIALTGQLYMASDFMAKLPPRRLELYKKTIPTTQIVPMDLYPYRIKSNKKKGVVWCCPQVKEFPQAIDLKVKAESGIYDVVGMFNWEDKEEKKILSLVKDLGLDPEKEYLAFEFWEQKLKPLSQGELISFIPPHGTRVYIIRSKKERPQLAATSRHITGAVSIQNMDWNSSQLTLSGESKIVKGEPYSLFFHVPKGLSVAHIKADGEILFQKTSDQILQVKFAGRLNREDQQNLHWSIPFERSHPASEKLPDTSLQ